MTAIWWVRRDLRLHDNPALDAALEYGAVIPLFVLDEDLRRLRSVVRAEARQAFLTAGLHALHAELVARGSRLVVRRGDPVRVLPEVMRAVDASRAFAVADVTAFADRRDAAVASQVPLTLLPGATVVEPSQVARPDGTPYAQFAPFRRAWWRSFEGMAFRRLEGPVALPSVPTGLASDELSSDPAPDAFPAGESEALARLDRFTAGRDAPVHRYAGERDLPASDATSALSPYLRFGMLSPRFAAVRALTLLEDGSAAEGGASAWLDELAWRDFFLTAPAVRSDAAPSIEWLAEGATAQAWREGRTGIPMVDAGMRQLRSTGWMHNRLRMLTASFLTKNLLVDWRIGEQWFMERLIDGDPTINRGNWQWVAAVGPSAAPYFRVFNPVTQGQRFDPDGDYVRRWVPELRTVREHIHDPWALGSRAPADYPSPVVDLVSSRARYLEAAQAARRRVPPASAQAPQRA